jgi:hypothetical protein
MVFDFPEIKNKIIAQRWKLILTIARENGLLLKETSKLTSREIKANEQFILRLQALAKSSDVADCDLLDEIIQLKSQKPFFLKDDEDNFKF